MATGSRAKAWGGKPEIRHQASQRWIVPAILLAASLASGCGYGRIQELGERAGEARSAIEVQLQRRTQLVPALVETLGAYGQANEDAIAAVADTRAALAMAVRGRDLAAMETAHGALSEALDRLMADAGRHALLLSDPGFQLLRSQVESTGEQIEQAASTYNEAVLLYNEYISQFPQVVTAKVVGAEPLRPFRPSSELQESISTSDG